MYALYKMLPAIYRIKYNTYIFIIVFFTYTILIRYLHIDIYIFDINIVSPFPLPRWTDGQIAY